MPHADLTYSADLDLPARDMLAIIEDTIAAHDSGAGACKGRARPVEITHHRHVLIAIAMLPKAHRDQAFITALAEDLEARLKPLITQSCQFSLRIDFTPPGYITNVHMVDGSALPAT